MKPKCCLPDSYTDGTIAGVTGDTAPGAWTIYSQPSSIHHGQIPSHGWERKHSSDLMFVVLFFFFLSQRKS